MKKDKNSSKKNAKKNRNKLQRYIIKTLANPDMVNSDTFTILGELINVWHGRKPHHCDKKILKQLKVEKVTDDEMESIRLWLISFATNTESVNLFAQAIRELAKYKDESSIPLLQGWLNVHIRKAYLHVSITEQLIKALENCGENVNGCEWDTTQPNESFDGARAYLMTKLNVLPFFLTDKNQVDS